MSIKSEKNSKNVAGMGRRAVTVILSAHFKIDIFEGFNIRFRLIFLFYKIHTRGCAFLFVIIY